MPARHTAGDCNVQALDRASHWDVHERVAERGGLRAQAVALCAKPGRTPQRRAEGQRELAAARVAVPRDGAVGAHDKRVRDLRHECTSVCGPREYEGGECG